LSLVAPLVTASPAPPAGADQISDLQAQAAQVAHTLLLEQLQVEGFQQQQSVAASHVQHDAALISQTQQQLGADQQRIDQDTATVKAQALRDYMSAGSTATEAESAIFGGGGTGSLAQHEYAGIASGNIANAIDALHTSRQTLQTQQAALQQQQAADQAAQAQQQRYLQQADTTESQLTAEQAQVKGQLASAVAQQQAAQAAAAAAAVRASEAAAAQRARTVAASHPAPSSGAAASGGTPSPAPAGGGGGGAGATSDPPLPPFLICVRQAESGGDYGAVSANGLYMGAFQFSQSTWNAAALDAGLPGLVGVPPNTASRASQDTLAVTLYDLDGEQPWYDPCSSS
jgi:peptidoglycan hydrolase CwlO-like protein